MDRWKEERIKTEGEMNECMKVLNDGIWKLALSKSEEIRSVPFH